DGTADGVAGGPEGGGQGDAGAQGSGDDAERAAGLVAGGQVPLVGRAESGVGQHAGPADQVAAVGGGAQQLVREALHGDSDLVGQRGGQAPVGRLDSEVERSGLGGVPGDDGAGPGP